jgi:hypothetical protein
VRDENTWFLYLDAQNEMKTTHCFARGLFLLFVFRSHLAPYLNLRGKLADMVLLSDNIFTIDPARIRDVKIVKTLVGGKTVWDRNNNATDNKGR